MVEDRGTGRVEMGVGLGILLKIAGAVLLGRQPMIGGVLLAGGFALFIWGCASYAQDKGYPAHYGALGSAGIVGLIALVVMKERKPGDVAVEPAEDTTRSVPRWFKVAILIFILVFIGLFVYLIANDALY